MSLAAVVVLGVMVAPGAQAAEVTSCVKVAKVEIKYEKKSREREKAVAEGGYVNKGCTEAAPENTGRYPGYAGPEGKYERGAVGSRFSTKSGKLLKRPKFEMANGQVVQCAASAGNGEWTGPKSGTQTVIFTGCVLVTDDVSGESCTSAGMATGEVESAPLELALISYPEELVQEYFGPNNELLGSEQFEYERGKVFVESTPQAGHAYEAEFECGPAASFRIIGTVAGHVKSQFNVMEKRMEWYVGPGEGVQDLRAEYSADGGVSYMPYGATHESYEAAAKDGGGLEVLEPLVE
ncbi:MAG TPA: hypothetical protein VMD79_00340 [Solirubrobacteraceae bacterium]|nr:hypothetical protein [Solirubrobacteraceae bacterium]